MKKGFFHTILLSIMTVSVYSQIPDTLNPVEYSIEQKIELLLEESETELDLTDITEELEYYRSFPLNLNSASADELARLNLLDPLQIEGILAYRRRFGIMKSIFELVYVDGFDMPTINKIIPFVTVEIVTKPKALKFVDLQRGRHQLFLRYQEVMEQQSGYSPASDSLLQKSPNSRYLGSPQKYYLRYNYSLYNKISFGLTAEKDAGEEFFTGNRKDGFDFYSAHLSYTGTGLLRSAVVGDYSINAGQGLVCNSGLSFGKGSGVLSIRKRSQTLRKYTSADENRFFRGAAATIGKGAFEMTAFGSLKNVDASLDSMDNDDNEYLYISSLQETGMHTTPSEIAKRKMVEQTIYGGRLTYNRRLINIGLTHIATAYEHPLGEKTSLYQRFDFQGTRMQNTGIDFSLNLKKFLFFGEAALNREGKRALLTGVLASPDPRVGLALLYRDYSKEYSGLYISGFGESGNTKNEKGLYTGVRIQASSFLALSCYADIFYFPWMRYRVDKPSFGKEYLFQADYQLSRSVSMYLRYKTETKFLNPSSSEEMLARPSEQNKQNFRYNLDYRLSNNLRLRSRFESSFYRFNKAESIGFLVLQDFIYDIPELGLSFYLRYALFDTDDYDTRIYTFENDVLYAFSVPSFYDRGSRSYGMIRYKINRFAEVWLKLSQTNYTDKQIIGSGLTEIQGNSKTELRVQVRLRW